MSNTVEKLLAQREQGNKQEEFTKEQEAEYKKAVQMIFDTPEGILFGKLLVKKLGIFNCKSCTNATTMIEENAAKAVYLKMIRPFLDKKQITTLEIYND